jgi:hypothetical protein
MTLGRNKGLLIDDTPKKEPGMSGSPMLADDGTAIGVLSSGQSQLTKAASESPRRAAPSLFSRTNYQHGSWSAR